ncbi:MAG: hypothetical protein RL685_7296, partial [Pseudomonadota bacterium]
MKTTQRVLCLVGVLALASAACSSSEGDASSDLVATPFTGNSGGASAQPAPGPAPDGVTPNAPVGGASSEGAPTGVALDPAAPVGAGSGAAGNGAGGAGGSGTPGDAGQAGSAPEPVGEPPAATVSTGCGKTNPPQGAASLTVRGAQADYLVTLPNGYSPDVPTPLVFAFHGRNRTHVELQTVD